MAEEPTPPNKKTPVRNLKDIGLNQRTLRQGNNRVTFTTTVRVREGYPDVVKSEPSTVSIEDLAKTPLIYARKHDAWDILDATEDELKAAKGMQLYQLAQIYRS